MNMAERLALAKARAAALKAEVNAAKKTAKKDLPRVRMTWDAEGTICAIPEKKPASNIAEFKPMRRIKRHQAVGEVCDKCRGSGRHIWHNDPTRNEQCFRCNGDGVISARDVAYNEARIANGTLCEIASA